MSAVPVPCFELQPMRPADLDQIDAAERTLYEFPWSRGNFADSLAAGYSAWVACLDGRLIGYAVQMIVLDEAHLLNLSVLAPWQGRGYGTLLLERLKRIAGSHGASRMYLEVRVSNPAAQRLYRRRGFERVGCRRGYYPAAVGREDAIVMVATL